MRQAVAEDEELGQSLWANAAGRLKERPRIGQDVPSCPGKSSCRACDPMAVEDPARVLFDGDGKGCARSREDSHREMSARSVEEAAQDKVGTRECEIDGRGI